jgi:uncharacterized membrane protein YtjA (UPF0391 family)
MQGILFIKNFNNPEIFAKGRTQPFGFWRDYMDFLQWAIIAFVISLIAGALGFSGVARGAATVAKVLFGIFLVIAVIFLILALLGISLIF